MKFATLLSLCATAYGLAFDGPLPTPVRDLVFEALNGWTPKPTGEAQSLPELFRRQQKSNSAVCGFLNGDSGFPLSCTAGACIFNTSLKWFGCCTSGTSNCEMMTRCVNSASVSNCLEDASCYNDPLAIACTASSAPHCINMYASISGGNMNHWVCGATATTIAVKGSATTQSAASGVTGKPTSVAVKSASAIQQGGGNSVSSGAGGGAIATGGANTAAPSQGGAAVVNAAESLLIVAGGLVGVFAVFL